VIPPLACDACVRRSRLVARLAPHIQRARERGRRLPLLLGLPDGEILAAIGGAESGTVAAELAGLDPGAARAEVHSAGLIAVCRCDPRYPAALLPSPDAPALLHVAGEFERLVALLAEPCAAIVGARRASSYGLEVARALGRGLSAAGVTVVSGLALGIDSAAHAGALEAGGNTVAVLASGADVPYPASKTDLYRRIRAAGAIVSELPPGFPAWKWAFPARNRIIAGLAPLTVVVEAGERSGSLITSGIAEDLGREVGAVPGRVTSSLATGPNELLKAGAHVVREPADVLDLLFGAGGRPERPAGSAVPAHLHDAFAAVGDGHDSADALAHAGFALPDALGALSELELLGHLRRAPGGRFVVSAG
jgi:DNA processing protein